MLLVMAQTFCLCHFFWQHVPNVHYFSQWYSVLILGFAPISNDHVRLGNRTIDVNLRKELVCSHAIHCASYIQRKEAQ